MFHSHSTQDSSTSFGDNAANHSVGVTPDFHHVPANSAVALESYMHLYLESIELTESTLKDSIGRRAA